MTNELILNETELLLLSQQLEANVSGVGFSLQLADVDTADFTGTEEGDIFQAPPVVETERTGWIRKIKFYVPTPSSVEQQTNVLLHVFRDGHIRCEKHVPPELMDLVVAEIENIKTRREYLQPLNELLAEFIEKQFQGRPRSIREEFQQSVNREFFELVQTYLSSSLSEQELRPYVSIIANLGIELCDCGVPSADDSELSSTGTVSVDYEYIKKFFKYYNKWGLDQQDLDYNDLADHIEHLLTCPWSSSQRHPETPLEMVEYAISEYDLPT